MICALLIFDRFFQIASVMASMQDDEAERVSRRSTMSGTDLEMNLTEENAQVSSCLRMFNENVRFFSLFCTVFKNVFFLIEINERKCLECAPNRPL